MALKVVSGGRNQDIVQQPSKDESSVIPRMPQELADMLKGVAAPAAGFLSGFAGAIPQFTSSFINLTKPLGKFLDDDFLGASKPAIGPDLGGKFLDLLQSGAEQLTPDKIQSALGSATGGFLEPEEGFQEGITSFAKDVGSLIGTGASPTVALGATTGSTAARELGFGPVGEIAGGVVGAGIPGLWKQSSPQALKRWSTEAYKKGYPQAAKAAKDLKVDATNVKDSLQEVIESLQDRLSGKAKLPEIEKNLEQITQAIGSDGKANVLRLWDRKRELNELISENLGSGSRATRNIYKRAIKPLNEFLQDASKAHPEFGKPFNLAEDLWKFNNVKSNVARAAENNSTLSKALKALPYAKAVLLGGSAWKFGSLPTLGATVAAKIGKRGIDLFNIAKSNPSIQKHLMEISREAAVGNSKELIGLIRKLDSEYRESLPGRRSRLRVVLPDEAEQ